MIKYILTISIALILANTSSSQETISLKNPNKKIIKTDRAPQLIAAQLGGPALGLSIMYDRRFNNRVDGLGFNIAYGTSVGDAYDIKFKTLPIGVNFLVGNINKGRYFEVGITQTILFMGERIPNNWINHNELVGKRIEANTNYTFTNVIIGYRSQPNEGGFNFRGGINPIIFKGEIGVGAYLSFGYNF